MSIVVLKLPDVKPSTETRPKACPYCRGETFQRWGKVSKPVKDNRVDTVTVYRYRCNHCRRTFRHYPEGVDRADQTQRMRKLAAICWVLGLSLRGVGVVFSAFGVSLSHMTVWRDMQEQAGLLEKRRRWQEVRVMGVDGLYPLGWGKKQPVLVAVDLGDGQPVAMASSICWILPSPRRGPRVSVKPRCRAVSRTALRLLRLNDRFGFMASNMF